jgi:magnesium chelatase subunit I
MIIFLVGQGRNLTSHQGAVKMPQRSLLLQRLKPVSVDVLAQRAEGATVTADIRHYPFLALVGQEEMKMALILAMLNPMVGGVLLIGPRGTGKTTAARGLVELMPLTRRSRCPYGCEPQAAHTWGMDAICPDCAQKLARGEDIMGVDRMRLIELPLNARLDDVVGGIDERVALEQKRVRLSRGILSYAHRNVLYIDEVNLLADEIVDAILDAAALGYYNVRRGPLVGTYPARFTLIGSMNPEEGNLRPQIMDRFGLRVVVSGLAEAEERLEVYRRVRAFADNPHEFLVLYSPETAAFTEELVQAKELLSEVTLTPEAEQMTLDLVNTLQIASSRAEIVTLEAARAHAAADGRTEATVEDVSAVAPMALRQRRSQFMVNYFEESEREEEEIKAIMEKAKG